MWLLIILPFSQLFSSSHYSCSVCLFHSWSIYWMDYGRTTVSSSTLASHSCSGTSKWVLNFAGILKPDMHSPFRTFCLLLTVCSVFCCCYIPFDYFVFQQAISIFSPVLNSQIMSRLKFYFMEKNGSKWKRASPWSYPNLNLTHLCQSIWSLLPI